MSPRHSDNMSQGSQISHTGAHMAWQGTHMAWQGPHMARVPIWKGSIPK